MKTTLKFHLTFDSYDLPKAGMSFPQKKAQLAGLFV